jgi:hypothetical protein
MRKFVIEGVHFAGQLVFGYNTENICVFFSNEAELTTPQLKWLSANFPFVDDQLPVTFPKSKIKEITDLSFETFWEVYDNKVGGKAIAEKLWNSLGEADKLNAIDYMKKYNYHLKTTGQAKAHPKTYLRGKYWIS